MLQHAIASVEREDEGVKEASLMGLYLVQLEYLY